MYGVDNYDQDIDVDNNLIGENEDEDLGNKSIKEVEGSDQYIGKGVTKGGGQGVKGGSDKKELY